MSFLDRFFSRPNETAKSVLDGLTEISEALSNPPPFAPHFAASAVLVRDQANPNDTLITFVTHVFANASGVAAKDLAKLQEFTAMNLGGRHLLQVGSAALRHVEVERDGATAFGMIYLVHRPSLYIVAGTSPEEIQKGISLKSAESNIQALMSAITKQKQQSSNTPPHLVEVDEHIGGYSVTSGRQVFESYKKDLYLSDTFAFLIRPLHGQTFDAEFHFNVTCATCEKPYEFSNELRGTSRAFVKCPQCRLDRWVFKTYTLGTPANALWLMSIEASQEKFIARTKAHVTDVKALH